MSFNLVYLSQQDPQWKTDLLGFGDPGDTIGMYGCALTSVSMLVSGHGYAETPKTLNEKLKAANGFVSSGIRWEVVSQVHPQITLKQNIFCETSDAPLSIIDAALAAGQPVVVRVDSSPAPGLQWHYVLVYARKGNDYLMLDPYPYQPGTAKEDLLMARYSQGNPLTRSIQQVLIYQCSTSGGTISTPASSSTMSTPPSTPVPASSPSNGPYARVKADVTSGLNIRSSTDTSSMANVVANALAGSQLQLLDSDGVSKIGINGQWVRVRTQDGREGYTAAWYLDSVSAGAPPVAAVPAQSPAKEAPVPVPSAKPAPASTPSSGAFARVKAEITWGLNIRSSTDTSSMANVVANAPAGSQLQLLDSDGLSKIGVNNAWVRVRTTDGKEGFAAAWYLDKVALETKPVEAAPSTPSMDGNLLRLKVSSSVGTSGLRLRQSPSLSGAMMLLLNAGVILNVVEPADTARAKIGKANQWIYVSEPGARRGYVSAEYVELA